MAISVLYKHNYAQDMPKVCLKDALDKICSINIGDMPEKVTKSLLYDQMTAELSLFIPHF